jgi:hypothetical protein
VEFLILGTSLYQRRHLNGLGVVHDHPLHELYVFF